MKIFFGRSYLTLIVLSAFMKTIQSNNESNNTDVRKARVNGRIVKLYSGAKPDPVLCFDEGFKADPVDCTVFYRCTKASKGKYNVFRFQCGPGTVYDPETEVCNHPSLTKRSECGSIIQPHVQEDENKIETYELPSPINTAFPVYTSHTESRNASTLTPTLTTQIIERYPFYKPTATVAYPQVTITEQEYLENSNNILNYPSLDFKNKTQATATPFTNIATNTESFSCTSDGFFGDRDNCRKFYRCVNNARGGFVRYEFLCSESTIWDDNMQSCNHPWAVQNRRCGGSDFYSKNKTNNLHETSLKNNQTQNNFEVENNEQQNYYENVVLDKKTLPYGHKLPDEKLNSSKQKDVELESVNQELPASQSQNEINKNEQQNDYNNELSNYYTTLSSYSSNIIQQNFSTQNIIAVKNTHCTKSGFMADPRNCKKFYRCVDNGKGSFTKYEFSCSQETVWDSTLEACNHAWAVKECGGISLNENVYETTQVFNKNPTSTSASIGTQGNGSDYMNQVSKEYEASSTTLTTISLLSTTESSKDISTECSSSGFFGDLNDCQKFYRCVDNEKGAFIKYDYKCGDGTLWDQSIEACNHDWAVKTCGINTIINTTQTSNQEQDKTTTNTHIQTTTIKNILNNENNHSQSYLTTTTPLMDVSKKTSENPVVQNNSCRSSGFMGDTYDCTKFYRCVDNGNGGYTRHEFSCGEGTVWDSEIEACNHAFAVKKCGASVEIKEEATSSVTDDEQSNEYVTSIYTTHTTASKPTTILETATKATISNGTSECQMNGFMGDKLNCKKFYRCVEDGKGGFARHEFSCGEGTVWDSKIQACNHEWAVEECKNNNMQSTHNINDVSMKPTASSGNTHPEYDYTTPNSKPDNIAVVTTVSSSIFTTSAASSKQECISNGFMGDQNDCRKFYRCVDNGNGVFTQYEFVCGQGTAWDPSIEACNHEFVVNCGSHSVTQFETTASSTQNQDSMQETMSSSSQPVIQTSTPVYTSSIASVTNENISNHEGKNCISEGFFANPDDCKKFFRCVTDGKGGYTKYEFSCGEGTIWLQEIQSCDHDTDVKSCNYTQDIATTAKYETTTATDNSIISSTNDASGNNKPNNKECDSEGFYPNLNDCRIFYRCVDNGDGSYSKHEFSCAEGTAWDVNIGSCNYISEVKGCQIGETIIDNNKPSKPIVEGEEISETEQETSTIKITTSLSTTESTKPISQNNCKKDGYYGNTEDCTKFYRCVISEKGDYDKYDYSCGEGTIWDQDIIACNHPRDVINPSCKPGNVSPPTTVSMSTQYTSDDNTNSLTTTSNPLSTSSASTSNKNETNSTCSNSDTSTESSANKNITCKKAGFYADPSDCKKFYRCVDWDNNGENFSIYHFECGDGTIWDPTLDTCNHIDAIYPPRHCNGTVQTENITELSSTTEQISTTSTPDQISSKKPVSTTKQTTVQPTTTTQQSTTQLSTTQQSTLEPSTAHQSTVEPSTTPQSTTQILTTQQTTTESSMVQESTTQSSTTQQTTTQSSTIQESTTQSSTTQESTTQSSTTQQSTTTEKITTQQETTIDSSPTTTQTSPVQTTISSTEQTSPNDSTTVQAEPNITTTTETSDQTTSTTDQDITTQQLATEQNTQTVVQSSTTEASTTESELESSNSNQTCLDTDEDQFLLVCPTSFKRHPKYCNLFYQCVDDKDSHEMKIAVFNCPNNTIYDESKVQCVEANKSVKKCNGQISQKRRIKRLGFANNEPVMVTKDSMACTSLGHFPFEKYEECSAALLKCELTKYGTLRGYVYKCPQGFVYWSISRRCEPIKKLKDCRKPSDEWERRYDIPIETYNVAQ